MLIPMSRDLETAEWMMGRIADATGQACVLGRRTSDRGSVWFACATTPETNGTGVFHVEYDGGSPLAALRQVYVEVQRRVQDRIRRSAMDYAEAAAKLHDLGDLDGLPG